MSHSEHTKEPWKFEYMGDRGFVIVQESDKHGDFPPVICQRGPWTHHEADGNRILACVNALAGVPNPPAFVAAHKALVDASTKVLSHLERILDEEYSSGPTDDCVALRSALRAVADTTGEKAT